MVKFASASPPSLCGLPIITEKRSSSSLKIFPQVFERAPSDDDDARDYDENEPHRAHMNGHSAGHHNGDAVDRKKSDVETYIVPIAIEDAGGNEYGVDDFAPESVVAKPVSFTAMQTDNDQKFTAIMMVRYYDLIREEYQEMEISQSSISTSADEERGMDQDYVIGKVLVTTTITTVADIYVHVTLAREPFKGDNFDLNSMKEGDGQMHQVTLAATTSTREVNGNIATAKTEMNFGIGDTNENVNPHMNGGINTGVDLNKNSTASQLKRYPKYHSQYTWSDVEAQLVFSSNGKHLACLIPRPIQKRPTSESYSQDGNLSGAIEDTGGNHTGDTVVDATDGKSLQSPSTPLSIKPPGLSTLVTFSLRPPTLGMATSSSHKNSKDETEASLSTEIIDGQGLPQPKYLLQSENETLTQSEAKSTNSHSHLSSTSNDHFQSGISPKGLPPIPCNPQILSLDPNTMITMDRPQRCSKLLSQITCLCDLDPNPNLQSSLLLAGCADGCILLIAQKRAILLGILYDAHQDNELAISEDRAEAVHSCGWGEFPHGVRMLKYSIDSSGCQGMDSNVQGKLLVLRRDGKAMLYSTNFSDHIGGQNGSINGSSRMEQFDGSDGKYESSKEIEGFQSDLVKKTQYLKWESKNYAFQMMIKEFWDDFKMPPSTQNKLPRFSNATWIDSNTFALLARPLDFCSISEGRDWVLDNSRTSDIKFNETVAQVWSLDICERKVSLLAELQMNHEKLDEMKHGFFGGNFICTSPLTFSPNTSTNIEYDEVTGCLMISSAIPSSRNAKSEIVRARNFITIWDWISCTIGFTLISANDSRFTIQSDSHNTTKGFHASALDSPLSRPKIFIDSGSITLLHIFGRDIYECDAYIVGILSPSKCQRNARSIENPNPIFLSKDYVAYPDLLEPSVSKEIQVGWKYSMIPPIYLAGHGPIRIATIASRFGRSLAVVGSKGLCVLDIYREDISIRNVLSNQSDNDVASKFSTSCLEGFQCNADNFQLKTKQDRWRMFSRNDESSFSVKVITWWENSTSSNDDIILAVVKYTAYSDPCYYLVAWSSHRLGMGRLQLLNGIYGPDKMKRLGIRLPQGFEPNQMTMLEDKSSQEQERAVVLLTGAPDTGLPYLLVQLQFHNNEESADIVAGDILGRIAAEGEVLSYITSENFTFLAEASFQFDLTKATETVKNEQHRKLATIGFIHSHGTVLSSASISSVNTLGQTNVFNLKNDGRGDITTDRIVKVWLSSSDSPPKKEDTGSDTWTWSFMKSNGGIFTWAIGGITVQNNADSRNRNFALHHLVCNDVNFDEHQRCRNFGIKSDEDRCLKGSIADESTSILGPLPSADHRHLLYSGQKCRISHGIELGLGKRISFWLYGVSDFDVGIPSSTASFLLSLSRIVEFDMNGQEQAARDLTVRLSHEIQQMHSYETTFAGLRAIVSFLTELESENESQDTLEVIKACAFLQKMQTALVQITMSALFQLQFVSLFLNVGRQLEPHHFHSLFPLSLSTEQNVSNQKLNLQDLFDMAVADGSFSVPAAALPLFSDRRKVHNLCVNLLHHCISSIFSFSDADSTQIGHVREEFRSMQQLYCYTAKLEDSEYATNQSILNGSLDEDGNSISNDEVYEPHGENTSDAYVSTADEFSLVNSVSGTSFDEHQELQSKEVSPSKIRRLAALLTPLVHSTNKTSETAISAAASTFIFSGYKSDRDFNHVESSDYSQCSYSVQTSPVGEEFARHSAGNNPMLILEDDEARVPFSSSGLIGMSICAAVFFSGDMANGLKNTAALSLVLHADNSEFTESSHHLNAIRQLIRHLTNASLITSMDILKEMNMLGEEVIDSDHPEVEILTNIFSQISEQWDYNVYQAVIGTIAGVLSRHKQAPEIACFAPLLSLILLASCHATDNVSLIFGDNRNCALSETYNLAFDSSKNYRS